MIMIVILSTWIDEHIILFSKMRLNHCVKIRDLCHWVGREYLDKDERLYKLIGGVK